jgi:hypothetical protein
MFGIFKKKDRFSITNDEYIFFRKIISDLPEKFRFLLSQVHKEFILGKKPNILGYEGSYTFLLNANLETTYVNNSHPNFFIIKDIRIWNKVKKSFDLIDLYVLQGIFSGYTMKSIMTDLDYNMIDITKIKEKTFDNEDRIKLKEIIGEISESISSKLDCESTFKIEILNEAYYVIKDLGDGTYLAVDNAGAVYFLMHDPYKIEKIFGSSASFIFALESGQFDIQMFYKTKVDNRL